MDVEDNGVPGDRKTSKGPNDHRVFLGRDGRRGRKEGGMSEKKKSTTKRALKKSW